LQAAVHTLHRRTSAEVAVLDLRGRVLAASDADPDDVFPEAPRAVRAGRLVKGSDVADGREEAHVALAVPRDHPRMVLDMRRSLGDFGRTHVVVRRSLVAAATVALAVALLAGLALAGRLSRRVVRLRDQALQVAELGPGAVTLDDSGRDEVGDLTRALATMQERLEAQERARRTFVSTASHELRTPLASLRLMLHGAEEDLASPRPDVDEARDGVRRALDQTVRLGRLAGELLDLSRIDAGLALRREPVELRELTAAVLAEFGAAGSRVPVTGDDAAWADGDPSAVARILRILVDNALRHGGGAGLEVQLEAREGTAALQVRDAGPGVAAQDAERIFERFERGTATDDGGFGLGLAIGRELARGMGGELRLLAGAGATLEVTLPAAAAP
jgi:signal transduction histidine kinase